MSIDVPYKFLIVTPEYCIYPFNDFPTATEKVREMKGKGIKCELFSRLELTDPYGIKTLSLRRGK